MPKLTKPLEIIHVAENVAIAESRPELHLIADCRENFGNAKEMIEFVVRAVNNFDALLETCKRAEPVLVGALAFIDCKTILKELRAAIQKAEVKP